MESVFEDLKVHTLVFMLYVQIYAAGPTDTSFNFISFFAVSDITSIVGIRLHETAWKLIKEGNVTDITSYYPCPRLHCFSLQLSCEI